MATAGEKGGTRVDDQLLQEQAQVELPTASPVDIHPPQIERSQVKRAFGKGNQSCGYECEFVQPPPEALQTDCSICLSVLREPHLISCCGHNFCQTCINHIKTNGKSCPLCNATDFTIMHNKGLERSLKDFEVHCTYATSGCEWIGKLGYLGDHLNLNSDFEKQLEGCDFVEIGCNHECGGVFSRRMLASHQGEECPKRPYSCDYCREYASTFEDVINHWPECKCYPLSCPHQCTPYAFERQHLADHLSHDCPLMVVNCDFQYAGCEVHLPRKDMPAHLQENFAHVLLLAAMNQKLTEKLLKKDEEINTMSQELKEMIAKLDRKEKEHQQQLEQEIDQLKNKQAADIKSLVQDMIDMREKQERDRTELDTTLQRINANIGLVPFQITMPDFEEHKAAGDEWFSEPFYTHPRGYKMCLNVYANGYGRAAKKTHISVYVHLMRGMFDEHLKWPIWCDITIELLNRKGKERNCKVVIPFGTSKDDCAFRVTKVDRAEYGWGEHRFISHAELYSHRNSFISNGSIHFQITKIEHRK